MMILVSLLIMLYIYRFALLLKLRHGWFILFFYIFDPLITAYAVLINSDLLSGFLLLAIVFHLFKFYQKKQFRQFFIATILMGVALVTKHTFLFGLPLFIVGHFLCYP
jgi:4-amino-4-deoxy-L-arabinose transferase-like glycosyltransferase